MPDSLARGLLQANIKLSKPIMEKQLAFLDELLRWSRRVNLTSIRDHSEAIEKHLLDSLLLIPHLAGSGQIMDMGSGGGLPGIPLAIAEPSMQVMSIDSVGKKVNFQKHIKRSLQLDNFEVQQSRIEDLVDNDSERGKYDLIVSRAFSSLDTYLQFAAPLVKPGGRILAMKGSGGREEIMAARQAIKQHGLSDPSIINYNLPFSHAARQIIVLQKNDSCLSVDNRG